MPGFKCPHNEDVHILNKCGILECPYHMSKVKQLFVIEDGETLCAHYDTNLLQNVSQNRTQISALSRDPRRRLSPKLMRSSYEAAVEQAKTLYEMTHTVSSDRTYCQCCGYPTTKLKCVSTDLCKTRREWVKFICSQYFIIPSITKYQIIWQLLFKNKIYANETTLKNGFQLCSKKDVVGNPDVPPDMLKSF